MSKQSQQPRSVSSNSPSHLASNVGLPLSTSSSPLHHSEYRGDDKGQSYHPHYGYNTPIRNQESHPFSSPHHHQHQQQRPQMRQHMQQRKANREGGFYYNIQAQQGGRPGVFHPNFSQGRPNFFIRTFHNFIQ